MIPLGYVVRQDGEFAAIVSHDDRIYIVGEGDRFAGQYRALSVTADAVEAVEDPPRQAHPPPLRSPPEAPVALTAAARDGPKSSRGDVFIKCESPALGEVSSKQEFEARLGAENPSSPGQIDDQRHTMPVKEPRRSFTRASGLAESPAETGIYVFQRLGSVETANGETRAIVAYESDLYLVKPGEIFAGRYRAISVDSAFVLARRETPGRRDGMILSAQAVSPARDASKIMNGNLHFPLSELENLQAFHPAPALASSNSGELGPTPLNFSLTGSGLEPQFFAAGNPEFQFWFCHGGEGCWQKVSGE
jgi:hypothetical protein